MKVSTSNYIKFISDNHRCVIYDLEHFFLPLPVQLELFPGLIYKRVLPSEFSWQIRGLVLFFLIKGCWVGTYLGLNNLNNCRDRCFLISMSTFSIVYEHISNLSICVVRIQKWNCNVDCRLVALSSRSRSSVQKWHSF